MIKKFLWLYMVVMFAFPLCAALPPMMIRKEVSMYTLQPLPFAYDALEPYMDARTVEIHHTKHQQGYVDKLNKALEGHSALQKMPLEQLLVSLDKVPEEIRTVVRNNGGGVFAHEMFWNVMGPNAGGEPTGELAQAIVHDFGSFDTFKDTFSDAAAKVFGSGWTWLCVDKDGKLVIISTPGHDMPMQQGLQPIMVIDVWEHAYYLKYQNRRPQYITNWWLLLNWPKVADYYAKALEKSKIIKGHREVYVRLGLCA